MEYFEHEKSMSRWLLPLDDETQNIHVSVFYFTLKSGGILNEEYIQQ